MRDAAKEKERGPGVDNMPSEEGEQPTTNDSVAPRPKNFLSRLIYMPIHPEGQLNPPTKCFPFSKENPNDT